MSLKVCSRCVYDESVPRIEFDEDSVCNYCHQHDELCDQYPIGEKGLQWLKEFAVQVKREAGNNKYDCVIGVSGGCDSSYLVVKMVELGMKPLAVHFDNTWNSPVATQNIYKVLDGLGVDLHTYVVDNAEYDDILRSFVLSGVKDIDAPTDLGMAAVLYRVAEKFGVKYIIEGHSFRTEGIAPLDWIYMDGRYIKSVHKKYGKIPMKTYPNMSMFQFIRWTALRRIQRVRPLYYMEYDKEQAKKMLSEKYGWEWYGGHHLENRYTAFVHLYFLPQRWQADLRKLGHAALVRSKQLERGEALELLKEEVVCPDDLMGLVKKRLGFSDAEFDAAMASKKKHWTDFPNYKKTFERLRPLFAILVKAGRVPKSFYLKFCFPRQFGE